jgi:D-alanyl-D-alanine carboxypeptidase
MSKKIFFILFFISFNLFSQVNINPEYINLGSKIDATLKSKVLKNTKYGISIFSLTKNTQVFSYNSKETLTPASTTKLFTSFAFMEKFGADYKLSTDIYIDGKISNGILIGDLYIRGGGDSFLSLNDIETIADQISAYGIKEINGNIYGDGSLFDNITERIDYSGDRDLVQATPPITALSINRNIATVLVSSANSKTNKNNIQVIPPSDAFDVSQGNETFEANPPLAKVKAEAPPKKIASNVVNKKVITKIPIKSKKVIAKPKINPKSKSKVNSKKVVTKKATAKSSKKKKRYTYITPELEQLYGEKRKASVKNKANKTVSPKAFVSSTINPDGSQSFRVNGRVSKKSSASYSHFIKNPVYTAAGTLKNRLVSGGIKVSGKIGEKAISAAKSPLKIFTFSRSTLEIIQQLMKHSDNYLSETLFKTLGALTKTKGNDVVSAQNLILHYIDSLKFDCRDCIVNDGSGLSRRNKLSAESMTNLFRSANNQPFFKSLDTSLSIAAVDGTLANRMWDPKTRFNLRAKTGTHGNVSALTGLVKTQDGELLTFSFIFNGPNVNAYKAIENELGTILANYSK